MAKIIFSTFIFVSGLTFNSTPVSRAMMDNNTIGQISNAAENSNETAKEIAQGKELWNKIQSKESACQNLSNDNFEVMGEYLMDQMMGTSHQTMNKMMKQMMGNEGEEQMHIIMAKRMTGCDPNAELSSQQMGFMSTMVPMMQMMGGVTNDVSKINTTGWWNGMGTMMGTGLASFVWLGILFSILFWVLIIAAIVALIKWIFGLGKSNGNSSMLNILKERYAKGEISKEEFEQKSREIKGL